MVSLLPVTSRHKSRQGDLGVEVEAGSVDILVSMATTTDLHVTRSLDVGQGGTSWTSVRVS